MQNDPDFFDFMIEGGDELLNQEECPHCGETFDIDEAEPGETPDKVKCPHCGKVVEI